MKTNRNKPQIQKPVSRTRRNNLLYGGLQYNGTFRHETEIRHTWYDADQLHTQIVAKPEAIHLQPGKVNWVQVCGLSNQEQISELCKQLGLTLPVAQDILNVRHISKVEQTGDTIFAVLDAFTSSDDQLLREHHSLVLGSNLVVSFEEGSGHTFDPVRKVLKEEVGQMRRHGPDFLFNLLISIVVDSYFDVLEVEQDKLLDMEDVLMEFQAAHQEMGRQIQTIRRNNTRLKKAIHPLRESFGRLLLEETSLIHTESRLYFRDTYDHLQQIVSMLDANRETIASLVDLYLANNDLRTNNIMKQLTVVSTIFIPLTFLVGVWGMNFSRMPELSMTYGYLYAWIIMLVIGVLLYLWFRKRNLF
jgi:magnesium transporter